MTRKPKGKKSKQAGLLTSMLIILISALVVSISLTIILFVLMGRGVYGRILANSMRQQARSLSEATADLFEGNVTKNDFHYMMRSSDTSVIVLDDQKEPFAISLPKHDDKKPGEAPGAPEGAPEGGEDFSRANQGVSPEIPPQDGMGPQRENDDLNTYIEFCRCAYDETMEAEQYSEYVAFRSNLGVVVGLPVENEAGEKLGAIFLIKPVTDIAETSKSVIVVLILSAVIVAVLLVIPIYFVSKWLTNPLKRLTSTVSAYSAGDLSGRVEPDGSREISELGETFNALADNLERNISDLTIERNRLSAVLNGLSEGLIAFDVEGGAVKWNNSASALLGGQTEDELRSVPAFESVRHMAAEVTKSGLSSVGFIKNGDRVIRVSVAPVDKAEGQVVGTIALLMDMTEAERLEQTRRDYVANVSHELRTPLASIRGIADMLNDGLVESDADKHRYYGYILRESIRLSTLINDLLELSRLQSGGVALELRKMELYELIADVADRSSEHAEAHGMRIELLIPEGKYYAYSNPDRVEQVLISLTDNAVKHGDEGGSIRIGMDESEDKWLIWVENPATIEEKDVEHIFERFYKADTAHTGEGTGLGLAITEEVLRLMGESISVKYEGGVIRFTFTAAKNKN